MKAKLQQFFYGRYGQDDLNRFLYIAALVLCVVSLFTGGSFLYSLSMVLLIYSMFRMLSKNLSKRRDENYAYLNAQNKVVQWFNRLKNRFAQRKTHKVFSCPTCKQSLRVPKGRGRISIHCPKCNTTFEKNT